MSDSLSARQTQVLKALIDEYIETAEPVGSEVLEKKYNLGVSSATVRNEMVKLTDTGYLRQPYTSAGRVPTPKAMKFYIDQLMEEKQMSLTDEVKIKEEVWDARGDAGNLIEEATQALAETTGNLSVGLVEGGKAWHAGLSYIFINPEFTDLHVCTSLFSLLDETGKLRELFFGGLTTTSPVQVLFGEELDWPELALISIIVTHFKLYGVNAALCVIGPTRQRYPLIIPVVKYFGNLMQEITPR